MSALLAMNPPYDHYARPPPPPSLSSPHQQTQMSYPAVPLFNRTRASTMHDRPQPYPTSAYKSGPSSSSPQAFSPSQFSPESFHHHQRTHLLSSSSSSTIASSSSSSGSSNAAVASAAAATTAAFERQQQQQSSQSQSQQQTLPSLMRPHSTSSLPAYPSLARSKTEPSWQSRWKDGDWPMQAVALHASSLAAAASSSQASTSSHKRSTSQQIYRNAVQQPSRQQGMASGSNLNMVAPVYDEEVDSSRHSSMLRDQQHGTDSLHHTLTSPTLASGFQSQPQHHLPNTIGNRPALPRSRSHRSEGEREEANRQKSKRHYDRKKEQRGALADLSGQITQFVEQMQTTDVYASRTAMMQEIIQALTLRIPMVNELDQQQQKQQRQGQLPGHQSGMGVFGAADMDTTMTAPSMNAVKRANERKRLNKLMQRHLEMQRIQQLSHIAKTLEPELRRYANVLQQSLLATSSAMAHGQNESGLSAGLPIALGSRGNAGAYLSDEEWESNPTLRATYAMFQPWYQMQSAWQNLILAEERLSLMPGRPLTKIVTCLRAIVECAAQMQHRWQAHSLVV